MQAANGWSNVQSTVIGRGLRHPFATVASAADTMNLPTAQRQQGTRDVRCPVQGVGDDPALFIHAAPLGHPVHHGGVHEWGR